MVCRRCCSGNFPAKSGPLQHKVRKDFKKLLIEINRKSFSDPQFLPLTSNSAENKHIYSKMISNGDLEEVLLLENPTWILLLFHKKSSLVE